MKKITITDQAGCYACKSCMLACAGAFFKGAEYDDDHSCIQLGKKADGSIQMRTCIQCGKCARTCEHNAITQNPKGVYMINKKLCVGCGKCAEACPMKVMVMANNVASKCIACGICAKACPMQIIEVVES